VIQDRGGEPQEPVAVASHAWGTYATPWDLLNTTPEQFQAVAALDTYPGPEGWPEQEVREALELLTALRMMFELTKADWTPQAAKQFEALGMVVDDWERRIMPEADTRTGPHQWLLVAGKVTRQEAHRLPPMRRVHVLDRVWGTHIVPLIRALEGNARFVVCGQCGEVRPVKQERARYCGRRCIDGAKNARRSANKGG
jgi:hypothetical protein